MARKKQDQLETKLLMLGRIADRIGMESVEYTDSSGSIKVVFKQKDVLLGNKKAPLSKKDKEELEEITRQREIDEMRHLDPSAYEDGLLQGTIKE